MHYAEGSLMPLMLLSLVFLRMPRAPMPFFVKPIVQGIADKARKTLIAPQVKTHLDFLEGALTQGMWFAGDTFSAADIQMSFPIEAATARAGLDAQWPRLQAFVERVRARPAYQRALERGGPFELMK
jgi:glutathione S-transferase